MKSATSPPLHAESALREAAESVPIEGETPSGFVETTGQSVQMTCNVRHTEAALDMHTDQTYSAPTSRDELLQRYAKGERSFPNTDLCDADLAGVTLDGANFEPLSWFHSADFTGASLRGTGFGRCNLKCATFKGADLTDAVFDEAAIESIDLNDARLLRASFLGATFYGITLGPSDTFP